MVERGREAGREETREREGEKQTDCCVRQIERQRGILCYSRHLALINGAALECQNEGNYSRRRLPDVLELALPLT